MKRQYRDLSLQPPNGSPFPTTIELATGNSMTHYSVMPLIFREPPEYFINAPDYLAHVCSRGAWMLTICPASKLREDSAVHQALAAWFKARIEPTPCPQFVVTPHVVAAWERAKPLPKGRRRIPDIEMPDDPIDDIHDAAPQPDDAWRARFVEACAALRQRGNPG